MGFKGRTWGLFSVLLISIALLGACAYSGWDVSDGYESDNERYDEEDILGAKLTFGIGPEKSSEPPSNPFVETEEEFVAPSLNPFGEPEKKEDSV